MDQDLAIPAYYYDEENGGRIPVFCPSMDEFSDFLKYVESINHYGMESGIVKIIPPKEWSATLPDLSEKLKSVRVRRPIVQHFMGSQGIYTQTNVEKRRAYTIEQWHQLCSDGDHRPPPKKGEPAPPTPRKRRRRNKLKGEDDDNDETLNVSSSKNISAAAIHDDDESLDALKLNADDNSSSQKQNAIGSPLLGALGLNPSAHNTEPLQTSTGSASPYTPTHTGTHMRLRRTSLPSPTTDSDNSPLSSKTVTKRRRPSHNMPTPEPEPELELEVEPEQAVQENSIDNPVEDDDHVTEQVIDDENAPLSFDYRCKDDVQYDVQCCRELERTYWRNLTFNQPLYGADMAGTLFDTSVKSWNVNSLDNILNRIGIDLPGVNTPYLYFGMWKATFAWHVEDMDLYSINYLHFGAPKQWYAIPSQYRQKFERLMQSIFFQEHKTCSQFLRHKTFIVSPTVLANHQIPVHRLVQHEGEFVITFPFGYHSGYNLGFNCAESVNFALSSWVQIGKKAVACQCVGDSVKIDVSIFEGREEDVAKEGGRMKKKGLVRIKLKDMADEDTRMLGEEGEDEAVVPRSPTKQKRKRIKEVEDEDKGEAMGSEEALRKRGKKKSAVAEDSDMEAGTPNGKKAARRTSKVEIMVEKKCILCLKLGAELLTEEGKFAHRICANYIPDTMIIRSESGEEIVIGVELIPKGRWKLKCQICNQPGGASIQCAKGKCCRAFHAICAHEAGMTIHETPFEDGSVLYEGFCRQHDPRSEAERTVQRESELKQIAERLRLGTQIWARWKGGSYYEGIIQEVSADKQTCRIAFLDGYNSVVRWKDVRFEIPMVESEEAGPIQETNEDR